jgi:uncharacterized membrane protein
MIHTHILDAWTRSADRSTTLFRDATIVGGLAAPLFLWLAGVALALSADRQIDRGATRGAAAAAVCRRGLEIFLLAFLFRLQAFVLSPGSAVITLFRVDILNIMGPAVVATGIVWGCCARRSVGVAALSFASTGIAMATPVVRTAAWVGRLPIWLQWYLRPAGDYTTFTGLPWAGFVFAGAAAGVLISASRDSRSERRLQMILAAAGASLIAIGFFASSLPTIYRQSSFWTSSPTYFAIRVGVLMVVLSATFAAQLVFLPRGITLEPLSRLGRRSLFVYWIHVELVYGLIALPLHHRLPFWAMEAAAALFVALIYRAVLLRESFAGKSASRRRELTSVLGA